MKTNNNNIIAKKLTSLEFNELSDYMQQMIHESILAYIYQDKSCFKDCSMEDYFQVWTEIWDEDVKVGDGLDTIRHKFVLNEDTRDDFIEAFQLARDAAYEDATE